VCYYASVISSVSTSASAAFRIYVFFRSVDRWEKNVSRGGTAVHYMRKVLDEEKALDILCINHREREREREMKKIPNELLGRIFSGRVSARQARQNGNFLIRPNWLWEISRGGVLSVCFTERQINSGPSMYRYIYGFRIRSQFKKLHRPGYLFRTREKTSETDIYIYN